MRFHVAGLPHTRTSKEFNACAYTQKVRLFCRMMTSLGHTVFHYGAEGSEVDAEHIQVISRLEQERYFGGGDWYKRPFSVSYDATTPYWEVVNRRTADQVSNRVERGDFLCVIGGTAQQPIVDAVGESKAISVEYGIGYYGTFAKYRVFESYTHQATVYGMQSKNPSGFLYDAVIPNSFDPIDFPAGDGGDYLLFVGRLIRSKGVQIAIDTAKAAGMRLVIAGTGLEDGLVIPDWVDCVGHVDVARRAKLMGGAVAILTPTMYTEPFGGVAVEAQMCGTPAITTNYAAFSETVEHGKTGYRCHTLEQFVWAAHAAKALDREYIRRRAINAYSIERVKHMYQEYFEMLNELWGEGWPALPNRRTNLDWLCAH